MLRQLGSSLKKQRRPAFTLIELIIVVIIVAILAVTALPRYYASVSKAKKISAYESLHNIRHVLIAYYAANGDNPTDNSWPIVVTVEGDTIYNLAKPNNSWWQFNYYLELSGHQDTVNADPAGSGWQPDCYGVKISTGAELDWSSGYSQCK